MPCRKLGPKRRADLSLATPAKRSKIVGGNIDAGVNTKTPSARSNGAPMYCSANIKGNEIKFRKFDSRGTLVVYDSNSGTFDKDLKLRVRSYQDRKEAAFVNEWNKEVLVSKIRDNLYSRNTQPDLTLPLEDYDFIELKLFSTFAFEMGLKWALLASKVQKERVNNT
ncbi:hypothetical protein PG996_012909 [Apiospora saccharicola]|uniref:Uncharacterized protein n=1 Tax=Apiospora saccharicola TaxID=335842 RepID=A0ABR1U3X9_9PEZI